MINLKIINIFLSRFFLITLIVFFNTKNLFSIENKIIFKIKEKAYTSLDYENRVKYLDFVGNNNNLRKKIIIEDYISSILFYEYFKDTGNDVDFEKINQIYTNINNANISNNKKYNYKLNIENILQNIKLDYIRKIVLENILNSNMDNLNLSNVEIDLLYNIKIKYINFDHEDIIGVKKQIYELDNISYNNILIFLDTNNIPYFINEKEINNINNINEKVRKNILNNKTFFYIEKQKSLSIIFIEKNFSTYEGIIASIFSIKSSTMLNEKDLKCEKLEKIKDNDNFSNKDYKFENLNTEIKNNLVSINDYIMFENNNENIFIVLCDIKFDRKILDNLNLNKNINSNVNDIEEKFINKYSKIYNLIIINA